jgi:small subunit ribosomal protein S8
MTADPIADMLTRVRNALIARHANVDVPVSRLKNEIARILKDEGYILNYKLTGEGAKQYIRCT